MTTLYIMLGIIVLLLFWTGLSIRVVTMNQVDSFDAFVQMTKEFGRYLDEAEKEQVKAHAEEKAHLKAIYDLMKRERADKGPDNAVFLHAFTDQVQELVDAIYDHHEGTAPFLSVVDRALELRDNFDLDWGDYQEKD